MSRGWNGNHALVTDADLDREEPDPEEPAVLPASEVMSLLGDQEPRPEEKTAPEDGGERGDSA